MLEINGHFGRTLLARTLESYDRQRDFSQEIVPNLPTQRILLQQNLTKYTDERNDGNDVVSGEISYEHKSCNFKHQSFFHLFFQCR